MKAIEVVSLVAAVVIVVSLIPKNQLFLRAVNGVGSLLFIVYGVLLITETGYTGYSTVALNSISLVLSVYHTTKLLKQRRTKTIEKPLQGGEDDEHRNTI